jgi:NADP-dependent 3-hydroxy acid dehydrogenase YdfG
LWQIGGPEFSRVIDVNIKGVANVIRHFVPAMIKRGRGVIVNFSSGWGRSVDAEVAPYVRNDNRAARLVKLIATCGPLDIDDPQAAITILMPGED